MSLLPTIDTAGLLAAAPGDAGQLQGATLQLTSPGQGQATVQLALDLADDLPDELALVVFDTAGGHTLHPLPVQAGRSVASVAIEPAGVVDSMRVMAVTSGRLAWWPEASNPVLNRLLSRNLAEVNRHVRWRGRIDDFDSRVFAALNSYRHLQADAGPAAYCLVSVGYTALEQRNDPLARYVYDELRKIYWKRLDELRGEARISFLNHLMHHSLYFCNPGLFEKVVGASEASLAEVESEPVAAFNAIVMVLLAGSFYMALGDRERAAEVLSRGDTLFRIAAAGYPRDPVRFKELVQVCEHAQRAQLGVATARGNGPWPSLGLACFDGLVTAAEVNRLRGAKAKARVAEWMQALVRTRQLRQGVPDGA